MKSFQDFSQRFEGGGIQEVLKVNGGKELGVTSSRKLITPDQSCHKNKIKLQKMN